MAVNILLNYLLIPKYQAFGAAIACLATQGFAGFSQYVVAAVKFKFGLDKGLIVRLIVYIAGVILLALGAHHLEVTWWISFIGMLAVAMILAMVLKLINLGAMVRLIFSTEP